MGFLQFWSFRMNHHCQDAKFDALQSALIDYGDNYELNFDWGINPRFKACTHMRSHWIEMLTVSKMHGRFVNSILIENSHLQLKRATATVSLFQPFWWCKVCLTLIKSNPHSRVSSSISGLEFMRHSLSNKRHQINLRE